MYQDGLPSFLEMLTVKTKLFKNTNVDGNFALKKARKGNNIAKDVLS